MPDYRHIVPYEECISGFMPGSGCLGNSSLPPPIQARADFERYPWAEIPERYFQGVDARLRALRKNMPDGMKAVGGAGNGIFECVQDITGYQNPVLCQKQHPAIYPVPQTHFEPRAQAVLMDLDGTSVHSEAFWMWTIEQTVARLLSKASFHVQKEDEPFISGHSVSEHLQCMARVTKADFFLVVYHPLCWFLLYCTMGGTVFY